MRFLKVPTSPEQLQVIALAAPRYAQVVSIALLFMIGLNCVSVQAQSPTTPSPAESYNVAKAAYSDNTYGAALTLPDGSVIKSVWPAALAVTEVASPLRTQPVSPRCEPAVYSLARVLPNGTELWAKSYLVRGPVVDVCDPDKWGFTVRSGLGEFGGHLGTDDLVYLKPYDNTFFIGDLVTRHIGKPNLPKTALHINADTGEVVGKMPSNMRVIDAYELRAMKQELWAEIERQYPVLQYTDLKKFQSRADYDTEANWRERLRYRAQFRRLEALIFTTPKSSKKTNVKQ